MKPVMSIFLIVLFLFSMTGCNVDNLEEVKEPFSGSNEFSYEERIFDNSYVHTIDVQISDGDWADLCASPLNKTKYEVDVVIDGEKVENVSFATKGNTSLSSVASDADSDRYSFKINFGKFVEGQSYYGLDKLNLNNLYADATYMKDYISYEIFRAAGVEAPLTSYVSLSINGEVFGLYIAIEEIDESYLTRNDEDGELYKPETEMLGNIGEAGGTTEGGIQQMPGGTTDGNMPQMPGGTTDGNMPQMPGGTTDGNMPQMPGGTTDGNMPQMPDGTTDGSTEEGGMSQIPGTTFPGNLPDGMTGGGMDLGMLGDNGASLKYTDDEISSYTDIFDNAQTDVEETDMERVIAALKGLSEGENLEEYIDVDAVIRYFVAHNFVMNYDSYTGTMLHNYFLYEEDGVLSILPWDYNLAFGAFMNSGMGTSDATSVVNYGIDSPLSGTTEEERPLWNWIVSNEEYLEKYHDIYNELITNYFESGELEKELERVYNMIKPYVEKDASAFYTAEEFEKAYATLKEFCSLRCESIRLQLSGELATKTEEQSADNQVDASTINIQDMGSQGGGDANLPDKNMPDKGDINGDFPSM